MKTLRISLLVLIIIGIFLLCTEKLWVPKLVDHILKNENIPAALIKPGLETTKHFTDKNNTFSFDYNSLFTLGELGNHMPGTLIAEVDIPSTYLPNTNFSDAGFYVEKQTDVNAIKNCLVTSNGEVDKGPASMSGYPFRKITLSDAGAGNFYETTHYRGIVGRNCYIIGYTIHSTNIGNYSPDQGIKEFDKIKVQTELENIVNSFRFYI
jgi:hypothetical protein